MSTSSPPDPHRNRATRLDGMIARPEREESATKRHIRHKINSELCAPCGLVPFSFRPIPAHRCAIDLFTSQVNLVDLPRVGDVLQRICVEHYEVGALAGRDHAKLIKPQRLGRKAC